MYTGQKVIVVGAGFFGATIAERVANEMNVTVLLVDKRPHVGGNSWSETDPETGIEHHVYGSHLFHTSNKLVWEYVNQFSKFNDYRHRVFTIHAGRVFSMPINLGTICSFYGRHFSPQEAAALVKSEIDLAAISDPRNLEEKAISLIGYKLYDAFIRGYTAKQWETDPRLLPASIITRLPVRLNFNDRYFTDKYEGLPLDGYNSIFHRMLKNPKITIKLGTDFFSIPNKLSADQLLIYTGPVDRFFEYKFGRLGWRTLRFEREVVRVSDFQGTSVMNYADEGTPFTRIHEFRHLHPERNYLSGTTLIAREYSKHANLDDEPYYPIATTQDKERLEKYKTMTRFVPNTIFGGRLGTYKYIDMHQAIGAALKIYESRVRPFLTDGILHDQEPLETD